LGGARTLVHLQRGKDDMPENHTIEEQPLDFDEYADLLLEQGLQLSPAELHGGICAVLVGATERQPDYCLAAVGQALEIDIRGQLAESSLRLIAASERAMGDESFEFHLFLPDDETGIEVRVQALGDWCRGFIAAYALVLVEPEGAGLGEEVAEILKDISAIAEVGFTDEEDEEEAEHNYFDITEYLRFAVLNLFLDREAGAAG
jgi:uncharacterized protein YgfB (UPF0149 family)